MDYAKQEECLCRFSLFPLACSGDHRVQRVHLILVLIVAIGIGQLLSFAAVPFNLLLSIGNVDANEELIKPSADQCAREGGQQRHPEVVVVPGKDLPTVAGKKKEEARAKVTGWVDWTAHVL